MIDLESDGTSYNFGPLVVDKKEFESKLPKKTNVEDARFDYLQCLAAENTKETDLPGISSLGGKIYRFPCVAVKGDVCATEKGLKWRFHDKNYVIRDNLEVREQLNDESKSVPAISVGFHNEITSLCNHDGCSLV